MLSKAAIARFHQCLTNRDAEAVSKLIRDTPELIHAEFENGDCPLGAAVGDTEIVKRLIDAGANVNQSPGGSDRTPLVAACYKRAVETVKFLLQAGADPNQKVRGAIPSLMLTPLDILLCHKEDKDALQIIRLLIEGGAEVDYVANMSPLQWAADTGMTKSVKLLLELGADANFETKHGTALHLAILGGHIEIVRLLLTHKANPQIKTPGTNRFPGLTALELAQQTKQKKIVVLLNQ